MTQQRSEQREPQRRIVRHAGNRFEVDQSKIPTGMVYAWKRKFLGGLEDRENMINADLNGWQPVPASRHPELAGPHPRGDEEICRGGLVLMEQPKEWNDEAREIDRFAAHHAVESQVQRLGLRARQDGGRGIARGYEQINAEEIS